MFSQASARIHGEPLADLPVDLYIPPHALEVCLEAFEGPLDLLLYLIRRHNLDILDIPMADLTHQYMDYVEEMRVRNLELAADYLLMSALLIEIKSRMLLPRRAAVEQEDDPRAVLVRRLLEYDAIKAASMRLDGMPRVGRDFAVAQACLGSLPQPQPPTVSMEDLLVAWQQVVQRAGCHTHHKVSREEFSVREHMGAILRCLRNQPLLEFAALFDPREGIAKLVVCFIAILELAREGLIRLTQRDAFSPIYVQPAEAP